MARSEKYYKWLKAGYELFAEEGLEGVQVEKLARKLELNKSGFYHYFSDFENYCKRLIKYHDQNFEAFEIKVLAAPNFDPEYLMVLFEDKVLVFFQMQLVRHKDHPWFAGAHAPFDERVDKAVFNLYTRHLNILDNPELVIKFHTFTRDMFYSRISWDNYNMETLKQMSDEISDTASKFLSQNREVR